MKKKTIIITGISGQDGSFLAEKLYRKYKIIGLTRRPLKSSFKYLKIKTTIIQTNYSYSSLRKIVTKFKPKIIFNLTGQSNPELSWKIPQETFFSIANITLNFLTIILKYNRNIKFFNPSTSEIFEKTFTRKNEKSKIHPDNIYGASKSFSHFLVSAYRKKYKLFLVNGILFNHESNRRDTLYFIKKLVTEGYEVYKGLRKKIYLQSLNHVRDFGYAEDYVEAMIKIMNLKSPHDFVIATGKSFKLSSILNYVLKLYKIDKKSVFIKNKSKKIQSIKLANNKFLIKKTGWKPKYNYKNLIKKMINEITKNEKTELYKY